MYQCGSCGKDVEINADEPIRCPFCGHKILIKKRPRISKRVRVQ
jgi:DNA-directed RNA polymerase subunit P